MRRCLRRRNRRQSGGRFHNFLKSQSSEGLSVATPAVASRQRRLVVRVGRSVGILLLVLLIGIGLLMLGADLWARHHLRATHAALDKQDYEQAWVHVQKALRGRPRSSDLHLLAARVARQSERMADAQSHLDRCYELQHGISKPLQLERMMLAAQMGKAEIMLEPLYDYVRNDDPASPL